MKDLFEGISYLTTEILLYPLKALNELQLESWFLANIMNWIFIIVGCLAFGYWMMQLKGFNDRNEEKRESTSHSFLG